MVHVVVRDNDSPQVFHTIAQTCQGGFQGLPADIGLGPGIDQGQRGPLNQVGVDRPNWKWGRKAETVKAVWERHGDSWQQPALIRPNASGHGSDRQSAILLSPGVWANRDGY